MFSKHYRVPDHVGCQEYHGELTSVFMKQLIVWLKRETFKIHTGWRQLLHREVLVFGEDQLSMGGG